MEILITVLLISVGFLATATMQVRGMRYSQSAYFQSQAYFLVTDMMDRMRGNNRGVELGAYDALSTSAEASNPGCASKSCDPEQTARQDLFDWSARLHALDGAKNFVPALPASSTLPAVGSVTRLAEGLYRVSFEWAEIVDGVETRQTLAMNLAMETP